MLAYRLGVVNQLFCCIKLTCHLKLVRHRLPSLVCLVAVWLAGVVIQARIPLNKLNELKVFSFFASHLTGHLTRATAQLPAVELSHSAVASPSPSPSRRLKIAFLRSGSNRSVHQQPDWLLDRLNRLFWRTAHHKARSYKYSTVGSR